MSTRRRDPDRGHDSDESGFTLVEVMVGMVILSIFMAIFGGAMVSMFRSVYRTQQTAYAQSNVNIVFGKLERELRYADGISIPIADKPQTGDAMVEFSNSSSGTQMCTELRLTAGGTLMQRSWTTPTDGTNPTMLQTVVLGTDLNADTPVSAQGNNTASVAGPFARFTATGVSNTQRLEVAVSSQENSQGSNPTTRVRHVDVTFAALNTDTTTNTDSTCSYGRSVPWTMN